MDKTATRAHNPGVYKRWYILAAGGLLVLPLLLLLPRGEPAYQGKSLSDWIQAMHQGKRPEREKARAAVHYLGSQSIPVLLEWLQRPDSPSLQARFGRARLRVVNWLEQRKLLGPQARLSRINWKESYPFLAVDAFAELGPDGKAAIPELIHLLSIRNPTTQEAGDAAEYAYIVLRQMAPASVPALVEALSGQDNQVWILAAEVLADTGPDAKGAMPQLRRGLTDPQSTIRLEAAEALCKLGDPPAECIPVVVGTLLDPDLETLDEKLSWLLQYKDQANSAVPVLKELLDRLPTSTNSVDSNTRAMITNALAQFSPDTLPASPAR